MIRFSLGILFTGLLFASPSVFAAEKEYDYLGGAHNLEHCRRMAGDAGYDYAAYGPGTDKDGVYYPYSNACFGRKANAGGNNRYEVYVRSGYGLGECADDIEWKVAGVRCKTNKEYLRCTSEKGPKQREIEDVKCVSRSYAVIQ